MRMYLLDQNMIHQEEVFAAIKKLFWIYYSINQRVLNGKYYCYFLFLTTRNCHHIWIRSVNKQNPQIKNSFLWLNEKIVGNLGSKKWKNNNNSTCQLNHFQNLLLMSIIDIPEMGISNVDKKLDKRKVRRYI